MILGVFNLKKTYGNKLVIDIKENILGYKETNLLNDTIAIAFSFLSSRIHLFESTIKYIHNQKTICVHLRIYFSSNLSLVKTQSRIIALDNNFLYCPELMTKEPKRSKCGFCN